jgi:hypothetical protein
MHPIAPAALARDLARGLRHDAFRYLRPDWRRDVNAGSDLWALYENIERKYRPDQPRVPAGVREGGQWTDDERGGGIGGGINDHRIISDASPDPVRPGTQYAQRRPPGFGRIFINGREVEPTPGQAARLAVVEAQARDAIRRVHELDPNWHPRGSYRDSVEGEIAAVQAEAREAEARLSELARNGIGPGPYAGKSIPARGPERNFWASERRENNSSGSKWGCHTCGKREPETPSGNWVLDHQDPTGLNSSNRAQRLYPQCLFCSLRQGGWVKKLKPR